VPAPEAKPERKAAGLGLPWRRDRKGSQKPFPTHDTTFFWADERSCAGEVLTTDGAYTKHKPIFGPLPGAS
jgi:hypothetical protein